MLRLAAERGAVGGVPDPGAGGARCRGGRARAPVARPQPHRQGGLRDRRTRDGPRHARVRDAAGRCRTPAHPGRPRPATRRRASCDQGRPRRQFGDLRRRRLGVDGGARPDVGGQRGGAVAVARCLSAPRQGGGDHVPAAGRPGVVAADIIGAHRQAAGWPGSTPEGKPHWRKACWPPAMWWSARRRGTGRGAAWSWYSPTGVPPADRTRWAAHAWRRRDWSPRVPPPSWWTAKPRTCDWVWPSSWPAISARRRYGWRSLRADALTAVVTSQADRTAA